MINPFQFAENICVVGKPKIIWFRWGSNPGPSACEADVITTTLRNLA